MPAVDSAFIGSRIIEARRQAGLTQAALAAETGLDRTAIAKVETGTRRVTAVELSRIAVATGRRLDWFVLEPPPAIVSYRAGGDIDTPASSIDRLLEQVAREVEFLQSLGQLNVPVLADFPRPQGSSQIPELAARVREAMALDGEAPITDLVGRLASLGLFAFSEELGPEAPDAATTLLRQGGVCVVNSSRAVGRRRLALAHELGHYLLADPYTVDWRLSSADSDDIERLIDAFARTLLLPDVALRRSWEELSGRHAMREVTVLIASAFRVDMTTLAARLRDLDLAGPEELAAVRRVTTTGADIIEHDLIVPHDVEGTSLPRPYEKAVLALYRAERISADRAVDLLHGTMDETSLPDLPPVSENEIWEFTS